jgi:[acyl-carrier-protein] S-malonyltransferase
MSAKNTVFVFPGQGAQVVGMGYDLFDHSPAARLVFEMVDETCEAPVSKLCFDGPEDALRETRNAQPALFAASVAALSACMEVGLVPTAVAGHSVGEYAALVAAESFNIQTGAQLVKARGEAMADAATFRAGTMAAVLGLDEATVAAVCEEVSERTDAGVVVVANRNAPGQLVISGETPAVEAASARLKERGAKRVVPLAVSGAFHSPLMELASAVMRGVLEKAEICEPSLPIIANVTADYAKTAAEVRANLAAQVAGPVRWVETIQRFAADGYDAFVECGPGTVLAGLIKRIAPDAAVYSVSDTATLGAATEALLG